MAARFLPQFIGLNECKPFRLPPTNSRSIFATNNHQGKNEVIADLPMFLYPSPRRRCREKSNAVF